MGHVTERSLLSQSIVENIDWSLYRKSVLLVIKEAVRRYVGIHTPNRKELTIQPSLFEGVASHVSVPTSYPGSGEDCNTHGPVYQIGIWTYNQSAYTGICFETKPHAKQFNSEREIRLRQSGLEEMAQRIAQSEYNSSIGDFLYNNFYLYEHPELLPLTQLDRFDDAQNYEAQRKMEDALLEAVREAITTRLFDSLPREEQIWIGISSPHDSYDHIVKY